MFLLKANIRPLSKIFSNHETPQTLLTNTTVHDLAVGHSQPWAPLVSPRLNTSDCCYSVLALPCRFSDYEQLPSGLQYKDMRPGTGEVTPVSGDSVVIDWDGESTSRITRLLATNSE